MKPSNMITLLRLARKSFNWLEGFRTLECKELARAIVAQEWGANGSLFVTNRSHWPFGTAHTMGLYVNSRLRAVVTYDLGIGDARLERLLSAEEAEQEYHTRKVVARLDEDKRQAARRRCISDLVLCGIDHVVRCTERAMWDWRFYCPSFRGWRYQDGMNGGTFHRDGDCVAADGAMSAAREVAGYYSAEEAEWDRALYGARF